MMKGWIALALPAEMLAIASSLLLVALARDATSSRVLDDHSAIH